jgi:hypothetical protein
MYRTSRRDTRAYAAASMVSATLFATLGMTVSAHGAVSQRTLATMYVPGTANVYSAGSYLPSLTGLPTAIGLPDPLNPDRSVSFPDVTGVVDCALGPTEPDGGNCGGLGQGAAESYAAPFPTAPATRDGSWDGVGIRGYRDTDSERYMALAGVFLTDTDEPPLSGIPETRLDFSTKKGETGTSQGHGFRGLSPGLKQVFFIGDGRTTNYPVGRGEGDDETVQQFHVPREATRLYLGFQDLNATTDNSGRLKVKINWRIADATGTHAIAKPSVRPRSKHRTKSRRHNAKMHSVSRRASRT